MRKALITAAATTALCIVAAAPSFACGGSQRDVRSPQPAAGCAQAQSVTKHADTHADKHGQTSRGGHQQASPCATPTPTTTPTPDVTVTPEPTSTDVITFS